MKMGVSFGPCSLVCVLKFPQINLGRAARAPRAQAPVQGALARPAPIRPTATDKCTGASPEPRTAEATGAGVSCPGARERLLSGRVKGSASPRCSPGPCGAAACAPALDVTGTATDREGKTHPATDGAIGSKDRLTDNVTHLEASLLLSHAPGLLQESLGLSFG